MLPQLRFSYVGLVAYITGKFFRASFAINQRRQHNPTRLQLAPFLVRLRPHVPLQNCVGHVRFLAHITWKRFEAGVHNLVLGQVGGAGESFGANAARIGLVTGVAPVV